MDNSAEISIQSFTNKIWCDDEDGLALEANSNVSFPEAGVCMSKQCCVLGMSSRLLACEVPAESMSAIAATVLSLNCKMLRQITVFFVVFSFVGVVGDAHAADQPPGSGIYSYCGRGCAPLAAP